MHTLGTCMQACKHAYIHADMQARMGRGGAWRGEEEGRREGGEAHPLPVPGDEYAGSSVMMSAGADTAIEAGVRQERLHVAHALLVGHGPSIAVLQLDEGEEAHMPRSSQVDGVGELGAGPPADEGTGLGGGLALQVILVLGQRVGREGRVGVHAPLGLVPQVHIADVGDEEGELRRTAPTDDGGRSGGGGGAGGGRRGVGNGGDEGGENRRPLPLEPLVPGRPQDRTAARLAKEGAEALEDIHAGEVRYGVQAPSRGPPPIILHQPHRRLQRDARVEELPRLADKGHLQHMPEDGGP